MRITKDDTTIIDGAGKKDEIEARCQQIRRQSEEATSDYDREKLGTSCASWAAWPSSVGGATEVER